MERIQINDIYVSGGLSPFSFCLNRILEIIPLSISTIQNLTSSTCSSSMKQLDWQILFLGSSAKH